MGEKLRRVARWVCWLLLAIVLSQALLASLHHDYGRASWNLLVAILLFRELIPAPVQITLTIRGLPAGTTVERVSSPTGEAPRDAE